MAIEAAMWRDDRRQRQEVALAWRIAALNRAKSLPRLKELLSSGPAKPLRGKELKRRRQEFQDMKASADNLLKKLNKQKEQ